MIHPKAWWALLLSVLAQAAGTVLVSVPVFVIPLLHTQEGMTLAEAGLLAAAPNFGMMLTLIAWGWLADRRGERMVIALGTGLAGLFAMLAPLAANFILLGAVLVLVGASAASVNAASGRVVVGWFPQHRRGLAMGIRQMSQPLGVAIAALVIPPAAEAHGISATLLVSGLVTLAFAVVCLIGIHNPPIIATTVTAGGTVMNGKSTNPYRRSTFLLRIHTVSVLLVVPQFTLSTFGLVWFVVGLEMDAALAGGIVAAAQFVGAFGRIAIGALSDRVGSRVRVLRWVALTGILLFLALAGVAAVQIEVAAAVLFILATTISVADNGLAFTSVAEAAGPRWSGKALGIQNTGQFITTSVAPPALGALITLVGYPISFALLAVAPLASLLLIPSKDAHFGEDSG
ncbi:MAG: MFS transporter [Gulosibacter sp.]|uniref:MFS transporter n=1 Tax=Gulosibacter sp. TaxID=2817531 RepID=UPI003F9077FB